MKVRSSVGWLWMVGAMFALGGPAAPGCATERAPINRVQPNYLRKSDVIPSQYGAIMRAPANTGDRTRPPTLSQEVIRAEAQWYHQITVLDKPATTGASGVTSYTQVERIYWEVTENLLIARQGYERLQDAQNAASTGQGTRQGEIVAAYTIESHFDIRNDYNATTGEPLNVVVENTTDRPWYQREFMRVDWSRNLVGTFTPITGVAWGSMQAEAQAYISTPDDPNRPVFDYGTHNGQANTLTYFDVTNRMILHPETVRIEGAGSVPACLLYDRITESCEPADVLLRVSFRRVDPSRDYAPMALDGHRMERFGFFEDARNGFNARTGTPGQVERRHYANRHNLWQQHHVSVSAGALDHKAGDPACASDLECLGVSPTAKCDLAPGPNRGRCGEVYVRCAPSSRAGDEASRAREADALCEALPGMGAGSGAHCDLDVASTRGDRLGLCLLPYRQRTVRPIAYHLSPNYPERIMPVTNTIMSEWRRVFNHAVREARYRECVIDPRGGGAASCERWRSDTANETRDARAVWTACHNPVWGTDATKPGAHTQAEVDAARAAGWDNEACGPQGTSARLGDTRYSMLASVNEYDAQGPWGLAMITGDPTTGEVLAGRGSVWLTVTDSQAAFATDMIRILNREITPERFALGQTIFDAYDYVRSLGGREERTGGNVPYSPRPVHRDYESADEINTVLNQTTLAHMRTIAPEDQPRLEASQIRALATDATSGEVNDRYLLRSLRSQYAAELPHTSTEDASARMARMQGTPIESMVVDREMMLGQEINPDLRTQEAVAAASPFRNNNMAFRQAREEWQRAMQEHECRADAAFSDDVISVLMHRFRSNVVPEDVRFGRTWNFHAAGAPATCPDTVEVDGEGRSNCPLDYEAIQQYLVQYIHYGVTLHELGHSVGERHNFSGSADPWNYDDRYWPLRRSAGARPGDALPSATAILPRWEHQARGLPFYSAVEEKGGVEEYAYSTVMDYVGWNQDAHGLGRYDRAFVMHGYVDMVEAFDQVADPDAMLNAHEVWGGGYQSAFRPLYGGTQDAPTVLTHHYTEIPSLVGVDAQGNPRLTDANRYPVFLRETRRQGYGAFSFTPDHTNMTDYGRDGQRSGEPHVLVPYSFGTDDWANNIWNTQRYDAGPDMYESMRYVAQHYQDYYFANAFARNRATFTRNGYRARMTSRYLDQMYYSMRNFVYLLSIYQNFYGGQAAFAPLFDPNSPSPAARTMNAGRLGSALVTDTLANSILMPQSSAVNENGGVHCVRSRGDGTSIYDRVNGNSCINIPVGAGREFASQYDFSAGFFWRDRLLSVGSYHDKQLGLEYLTSTFQWVPGRYIIEFGDVHQLQINFYTLYPGATLRFFGSLLSRDYDDVGVQARPRADSAEPELFRTQYARLNLPFGSGPNSSGRDHGVSARAVNPNLGFTLELDALAYLRGQLELTFDRTARVSAMLWHENDHWALADNATRDLVTFTNPYTGVAYHAVHISGAAGTPGAIVGVSRRDSAVDETGIAARMLQYANRLSAQRDRTPAAQRANIDNELHGYIDLLDALRDVSHLYN